MLETQKFCVLKFLAISRKDVKNFKIFYESSETTRHTPDLSG